MKLKKGILIKKTNQGAILVAPNANTSFTGTMTVNETAAFILHCLKRSTNSEAVFKRMSRKFDGDAQTMRDDIEAIIDELRKNGLIDE